uniref:SRP54-type proteins GTP-binding domain-containing protein n=1 Tax=Strombidium rassoulzadegani TaxID=1082188 RepID=A0A7S3FR48_9SPIT|mmetsp:Transcript_10023/g.16842  ORF Transcript_10023/g.16842 Transcript_10023/m.16842 type:complete len:490 (+) Transcript_10023:414-1883(+)
MSMGKSQSFNQFSKKKKKKNQTQANDHRENSSEDPAEDGGAVDSVTAARQQLRQSNSLKSGGRSSKNKQSASKVESQGVDYDSDEAEREYQRQRQFMMGPKKFVDEKDMKEVDLSVPTTADSMQQDIEEKRREFLGGDDDDLKHLGFCDSDEEIDFSNFKSLNQMKKDGEADEEETVSLFGRLTSAIKNVTGNKVLTKLDIQPILSEFSNSLTDKNVSVEIAQEICKQVEESLVGVKTASFTSIKTTVQKALVESIQKLLTPKRNIDILKEAVTAKKRGQVYSIVFIGVNGVGKSTSLAKTAYYLKTKGNLRVMLAGCDNFRSGAIEQLQTHASCLDVPLYQKGYKDDPAIIAKEALQDAKSKGFDVVLIDTAGRMQGNEGLMRALAKLVQLNKPDTVLFVGEALVGNDSIDQLTKFNQSLIDFAAHDNNPRVIDGIIMTKFDTVDEKVGTALNMVYSTGKPIVFVGVGQKYPHLKKLNVQTVITALMS